MYLPSQEMNKPNITEYERGVIADEIKKIQSAISANKIRSQVSIYVDFMHACGDSDGKQVAREVHLIQSDRVKRTDADLRAKKFADEEKVPG